METQERTVVDIVEPTSVMEGAGVKLRRSMPTRRLDYLDPFLLFDHFGSHNPADYLAGFPMHPHRGIETVTYMLAGTVNHKDSLGNAGSIGAGDAQWMTSGRGIMHEEMPQPVQGEMAGFQLWVNLRAKLKMSRPRYQEINAGQIPVAFRDGGVAVRVIAGSVDGVRGPVAEIIADPTYIDVTMPPAATFSQPVGRGHTAFAYIFEGEAAFGDNAARSAAAPRMVVWGDGDAVVVRTVEKAARFLLISGMPLFEPIARYGPFVMNTREEIEQALRDLRDGTFVQP